MFSLQNNRLFLHNIHTSETVMGEKTSDLILNKLYDSHSFQELHVRDGGFNNASPAFKQMLQNNQHLIALHLNIPPLTHNATILEYLTNHQTLQEINIEVTTLGNTDTQSICNFFKNNASIKKFNLISKKYLLSNMDSILSALKRSPSSFKELSLNNVLFNNQTTTHLIEFLKKNSLLNKLKLNSSKWTNDNFIHFLSTLINNTTLQELDLRDSILPTQVDQCSPSLSFVALSEYIKKTSSLKKLYLPNFSNPNDFLIILEALHQNNTIEELSLKKVDRWSNTENLLSLEKYLREHIALKKLNLSHLAGASLTSISQGLKNNPNIEELTLISCKLDQQNVDSFCDFLQNTCCLKKLNLTDAYENVSIFQAIQDGLNLNNTIEELVITNTKLGGLSFLKENATLKKLTYKSHITQHEIIILGQNQSLSSLHISTISAEQGIELLYQLQTNQLENLSLIVDFKSQDMIHPFLDKLIQFLATNNTLESLCFNTCSDGFNYLEYSLEFEEKLVNNLLLNNNIKELILPSAFYEKLSPETQSQIQEILFRNNHPLNTKSARFETTSSGEDQKIAVDLFLIDPPQSDEDDITEKSETALLSEVQKVETDATLKLEEHGALEKEQNSTLPIHRSSEDKQPNYCSLVIPSISETTPLLPISQQRVEDENLSSNPDKNYLLKFFAGKPFAIRNTGISFLCCNFSGGGSNGFD